MTTPIRLFGFIFIIFSSITLADTVWMKNGDRLTGQITLLNNNRLVLETDYAGTVTIAWSKISTIESDSELLVTAKNKSSKTESIKPSKEGAILLINGEEKKIALTDVSKIIKPKPIVEDLIWTGKISIAFDKKKAERDTTDFDIDFLTKLQHDNLRHTFEAEYNRKTRNEKVSTDNYKFDYTLDLFMSPKFFWQTNTSYSVDRIEDLYKQYSLGFGPGYQFWDNSLGSFSLATLVNASKYEYRTQSNRQFASAGIRWSYNRFILGKDIELFSNGSLYRPFNASVARYALDTDIGLRYKLTNWASFNIKYSRNIIDSDSDANLDEARYIIGFGINW